MKKVILLFILISFQVQGQEIWHKESIESVKESKENIHFRKSTPNDFDVYSIDLEMFKSSVFNKNGNSVIDLPINSKGLQKFRIVETSNLAPELAAKYPMIRSFTGYGIDDPTAFAKIDFGTNGMHAIVFSGKHSTVYIDPYTKNNKKFMVYERNSLEKSDQDFACMVEESKFSNNEISTFERTADDGKLRTFRLAIVSTGEYSQFHLTNQGVDPNALDAVKKGAVLSAMNTTMNRVNGVFEKDLSVKLEIVANNDQIIFLDPGTDGLSNSNAGSLINESQSTCDGIIGSANYDIGHAFSTGGGGLAGLGVVCLNGQKARGITGRGAPINDPYDIDYVAHEIGHQFGANHTQNNSCQRNSSTAVEPGSASTIMGYAGICSPNVQSNSDDHFHAVSINEMWTRIQNSATCAVETNTNNAAPTADAGADVTIPKSTPFVLRGVATDADGTSSHTYNWEQTDNEIGTMPPQSSNTGGPMFRSLPSKTSPNRYLPRLSTLSTGNNSSTWEVLPSVAREMNFSFLVRDNNSGGGSTARDDIKVTVIDATPFSISSPGLAAVWEAGTTRTVSWDKGTTDVAPINCQLVNIKLSIDGGLTYPITILENTPNDGTQDITVPNNPTSQARIMVEAADNIFFNINFGNFTINESTASVDNNQLENFNLYPNPSKGTFKLNFTLSDSDRVYISLYDIRGRRIEERSYNNLFGSFSETVTFNNLTKGVYLMQVQNGSKFTTKKVVIN
ncbi:reprolysin-like metallopeptidase [Pseudotenacibaculum sp. MALMAid0570]|uniref:zinc-dependent metalloprotease n=1 Tax=Pseudotenacibaculum sp. MALMAid0570 TaxID=3143938 RepID=UPI0032E03044